MSVLGSILSSIFGGPAAAAEAEPAAGPTPPPASRPAAAPKASPAQPPRPSASSGGSVDVAAILDGLTAKKGEKGLDWRKSIVDLMKVLDLDSSLAARKALAKELAYDGNTKNSSAMNVWLHKQVMAKVAANGGKVPDDLKD